MQTNSNITLCASWGLPSGISSTSNTIFTTSTCSPRCRSRGSSRCCRWVSGCSAEVDSVNYNQLKPPCIPGHTTQTRLASRNRYQVGSAVLRFFRSVLPEGRLHIGAGPSSCHQSPLGLCCLAPRWVAFQGASRLFCDSPLDLKATCEIRGTPHDRVPCTLLTPFYSASYARYSLTVGALREINNKLFIST